MTSLTAPPTTADSRRARPPARWEWIALAAVLVGVAVLALVRWPGHAPIGSDHDEYRMVAETLWSHGEPTVAGIEATKYPLGYPVLLGAVDRIGLPMTGTALALNVALVLATVVVTWLVARRLDPAGGLVAAAVVGISPALWSSVYDVMPDLALTTATVAAFAWMATLDDGRPPGRAVMAATGFAVLAVALKTFGIVLAGALGVALFAVPRLRIWSWVPPAAGLAVTAVQTLAVAAYPDHTTGYAATFWLRDVGDAAAGTITAGDLPARMWGRLDGVAFEIGHALLGRDVGDWVGGGVVAVLLVAAVVGVRRWRWPLAAYLAVSVAVLAAWPYRSPRFGLPMLPLAAVGAAVLVRWLVHVVGSRTAIWQRAVAGVGLAGMAVALAVHAVAAVDEIRDETVDDRQERGELHAALDDLRTWADGQLGADEAIASFDYRALAYRLDRPVLPLGYTTDTEVLWEASGGAGADWLITVRGLAGRRSGLTDTLVAAYPDRFRKVYANERIDVFRIDIAGAP